ncbi:thioester domain-containing protein [Actinophytocola sp.]|uniref:thioester domain-containing protein n=1 Tax=Actinophytocola sp. TaxID=1872138 RepID=UPI002ED14FA4
MASRLKLARAGAAVAGASVALMLTAAIPAGAESATGNVDPDGYVDGYNVDVGDGKLDNIATNLITLKLDDGTKLQMYCVEIETRIKPEQGMVEKPWDSYPNAASPFHKNRDKINWILHHSFPVVGLEALNKTLSDAGVPLNDGLDTKEAIAGTQAAVWHYSDGKDLNAANPFPKDDKPKAEADVLALYKYLTGPANVGIGDQPTPALSISPTDLSGKAGEKIGPFTVTTTGDIEKLTTKLPEGVKVVDAQGNEVTAQAIKNGAQLFLSVPAGTKEGAGTFELSASAALDTGRLFVGEDYENKPTQSLIVAISEKTDIVASAGAKWAEVVVPPTTTTTTPPTTSTTPPTTTVPVTSTTPVPQPKNTAGDLPNTGASIFAPIVIGVVLVGAGVGSLLFLRRRKRA